MSMADAYEQQCSNMSERFKAWRIANPDKTASIQFNFPPGVCVIAPISEAVKRGLVSTNEAGLDLLKALGDWGSLNEPTVLMVRVVLESPCQGTRPPLSLSPDLDD